MCKNARRGICLMQKMCYTNCKLYDSMRKREENSMVTAVRSLGLQGISGYEVTVECFFYPGACLRLTSSALATRPSRNRASACARQ